MQFQFPEGHDSSAMWALRREILDSPLAIALERARVYTEVFRENETAPWIVTKAMAFRRHLETVPLFLREHDRIAGSICEVPGGMPINVEIGIGENGIFTREDARAQLLAAPKHGNDAPQLRDVVKLVETMRDAPLKEICRDPRDGSPFGNCHVVRSGAVLGGRSTGATPDGRLAGTPLAGSVAAAGTEKSGPTALINSILALSPTTSWQCGYNVNMRLQHRMLADPEQRRRVRTMLDTYFREGGQEMQINCVDAETLREARANPEQHRDLVVRVAGFSEFFTKLHPAIQNDIICREEHEA